MSLPRGYEWLEYMPYIEITEPVPLVVPDLKGQWCSILSVTNSTIAVVAADGTWTVRELRRPLSASKATMRVNLCFHQGMAYALRWLARRVKVIGSSDWTNEHFAALVHRYELELTSAEDRMLVALAMRSVAADEATWDRFRDAWMALRPRVSPEILGVLMDPERQVSLCGADLSELDPSDRVALIRNALILDSRLFEET